MCGPSLQARPGAAPSRASIDDLYRSPSRQARQRARRVRQRRRQAGVHARRLAKSASRFDQSAFGTTDPAPFLASSAGFGASAPAAVTLEAANEEDASDAGTDAGTDAVDGAAAADAASVASAATATSYASSAVSATAAGAVGEPPPPRVPELRERARLATPQRQLLAMDGRTLRLARAERGAASGANGKQQQGARRLRPGLDDVSPSPAGASGAAQRSLAGAGPLSSVDFGYLGPVVGPGTKASSGPPHGGTPVFGERPPRPAPSTGEAQFVMSLPMWKPLPSPPADKSKLLDASALERPDGQQGGDERGRQDPRGDEGVRFPAL